MKIFLSFAIVFLAQFLFFTNIYAGSLPAEIEKLKKEGIDCENELNFKAINGKPGSWICYQSAGRVMFELKADSGDASKIKSIEVTNYAIKTKEADQIAENWVKIVAEKYGRDKSAQIIDAFKKGERSEVKTDQFNFVFSPSETEEINFVQTLRVLAN